MKSEKGEGEEEKKVSKEEKEKLYVVIGNINSSEEDFSFLLTALYHWETMYPSFTKLLPKDPNEIVVVAPVKKPEEDKKEEDKKDDKKDDKKEDKKDEKKDEKSVPVAEDKKEHEFKISESESHI